ncbi:MAG TPA: PhnA protein [Devosia sp.]|nr:PhnA protein [Devosia sp.]
MSILNDLQTRSESKCELCNATDGLDIFTIPNSPTEGEAASVYACATCRDQMQPDAKPDVHHWRCLNESMWSQTPAVQVMAWRMLNNLSEETWARDALDMLYLEEETLAWAKAGTPETDELAVVHKDANGAILNAGDTVTLIKDLVVKGAGFTAKRGTPVRNISLVADNEKHIEGRVSGQQIVILTEFVKRS